MARARYPNLVHGGPGVSVGGFAFRHMHQPPGTPSSSRSSSDAAKHDNDVGKSNMRLGRDRC